MKQPRNAFTLIELLVVIAIIGLLASIVLVALNGARSKSRDAKRLADLRELQTAMELYYSDNNTYPTTACPPNAAESTPGGSYSTCWSALLPSQYVATMPNDPTNAAGAYGYYYVLGYKPNGNCSWAVTGSPNNYMLATRLENPTAVPNSCPGGTKGWDNASLNYIVGM